MQYDISQASKDTHADFSDIIVLVEVVVRVIIIIIVSTYLNLST